jgi:prepilin-type N-terminal cleavage/methylation domain-containing protein
MRRRKCEAGFTLIETIVVTAIIVVVAGTLGTFFLGGASPAVASADRDVLAALGETRRAAAAFDAATLVFAPARSGPGYSARVYARFPGDPDFAPRNGPTYDSTVAISETQAPLGAPGFALAIDSRGAVTGFASFSPGQTAFASHACPAAGVFALQLTYERETRVVDVPCQLPVSASAALVIETPAAGYSPTPFPVQTCPAATTCVLGALAPAPPPPTAAPSTAPATPPAVASTLPIVPPSPPPAGPTACPAGFGGIAPACSGEIIEQYSAQAGGSSGHESTLFADGSICDDYGCSLVGPIAWVWGCPFSGRSGSNGYDGSNAPYQPDTPYDASASAMIGRADQDAAEAGGSGIVSTEDSYCAGFPVPNP